MLKSKKSDAQLESAFTATHPNADRSQIKLFSNDFRLAEQTLTKAELEESINLKKSLRTTTGDDRVFNAELNSQLRAGVLDMKEDTYNIAKNYRGKSNTIKKIDGMLSHATASEAAELYKAKEYFSVSKKEKINQLKDKASQMREKGVTQTLREDRFDVEISKKKVQIIEATKSKQGLEGEVINDGFYPE